MRMMKRCSTLFVAVMVAACTPPESYMQSPESPEPTTPAASPCPSNPPDVAPPASAGGASSIAGALALLEERVLANQMQYYVYRDADSGFNHGFPSGFFADSASTLDKITLDAACLDEPNSASGCSSDPARLDHDRGTVLRVAFDPLAPGQYAGVNIEEPEHWGAEPRGTGYDLTGATAVVFDIRSPTPGGLRVQFGVGGKVTSFAHIAQSQTYRTLRLLLDSLTDPVTGLASPPALDDVHVLLSIATNDIHAPLGGVVFLDNVRFEPAPLGQVSQVSFPQANEVFGVVHRTTPAPGRVSFPLDQVLANTTTCYETALTFLSLSAASIAPNERALRSLADAFHYALHHDNSGMPLPQASDGSTGLHSAYSSGDLALLNSQQPGAGRIGEIRLAGFTASPELCGDSGYCLVLDGATGGNNSFAILALLGAYERFLEPQHLEAARTIARWIVGSLRDESGTGFGGYFLGYPDAGAPKTLIESKSTENNADVFAALMKLAAIERTLGNDADAEQWTGHARVAGNFVMSMFDEDNGRFFAGTVPLGTAPGPGIDPSGRQQGADVINVFDFLDSNSFSVLSLARSYRDDIDWRRPVRHILDTFAQSVTAGGHEFHGFSIVSAPTAGPNGIAWEFTGQAVVAMRSVDALYGETCFERLAAFYLDQIRQAQRLAPFGDGRGLVASTLQDGDALPPIEQCLSTPFQCIPERVGLAATAWAILAEQSENPLMFETSYD